LKKYITLGSIVAFIVAADQFTKFLVLAKLELYESVVLIGGFLNLVHVRNPGAAFGMLANLSPSLRMALFFIVALLVLAFIIYLILTVKGKDEALCFPLALIFAGTIGNTIDRFRFGEVIDFIDCYIGNLHWPAFNIADSALSLGAIWLLLALLIKNNSSTNTKIY